MMKPVYALSTLVAVITLVLMSASLARAQTLTTLYSFCTHVTCTTGSSPESLIQATYGDFYGTTAAGGANDTVLCSDLFVYGCGTVFKVTPAGKLTTLYSFCTLPNCTDGAVPAAALIQAINGDFYGTTPYGGTHGGGTVFKITASGKLTTLYNFCTLANCADGSFPQAALIQAANGDLFGTTAEGGASNPGCTTLGTGCGTIFKITPNGTLTTLYSFCTLPNCTDGAVPGTALIQAANGDFYGTTELGGLNPSPGGTVFKITPTGTLTTLYSFCSQPNCADGYKPNALLRSTHGDLYGMTVEGGFTGNGTVFKITANGTLTTLYNICSQSFCTDGTVPASLIQATNGDLYGTTLEGGLMDYAGTLFMITPSGTLTKLYNFCSADQNCSDGAGPNALIQATNGDLYGTTAERGAAYNGGTIYSVNVGLGPFVAPKTTSGEAGAKVILLGTDLTGATSVTFNGTPATFTVNSTGFAITATVPVGATTGTVQVVTPNGTLDSNVAYTVW
jgi:uncharacterized repeat protein (TIGR03803 family)